MKTFFQGFTNIGAVRVLIQPGSRLQPHPLWVASMPKEIWWFENFPRITETEACVSGQTCWTTAKALALYSRHAIGSPVALHWCWISLPTRINWKYVVDFRVTRWTPTTGVCRLVVFIDIACIFYRERAVPQLLWAEARGNVPFFGWSVIRGGSEIFAYRVRCFQPLVVPLAEKVCAIVRHRKKKEENRGHFQFRSLVLYRLRSE